MTRFLKEAGCSFYPEVIRRHLLSLIDDCSAETIVREKIAAVFVGEISANQQGVYPTKDFPAPAAQALKERGLAVHWFDVHGASSEGFGEPPSQGSLQLLLRKLAQSEIVVTAADRIGILAQLLGCKTAIVFGARLPQNYVLNWDIVTCFANTELECLGCQDVWGTPSKSFCLRRDEACVASGLGAAFANQLTQWLDGRTRQSLPQCSQSYFRTLSSNRRRSSELDLSSWPD